MSTTLICLHGWGGDASSFTELRESLNQCKNDSGEAFVGNDLHIFTPDLPGFGTEPEPARPWSTDDYADWVQTYIQKHVHGPYLLLGHSHGGRIAIKLIGRGNATFPHPQHLFLCAAAGIRHPRHFKRIIGLTLAKTGSFFLSIPGLRRLEPLGKKLLYRLVRVHDYERASPVMRETMIKVSAEDLRPLLSNIAIPTDLFWGKDDGMTPFRDALIMERAIPNATLHAYAGVRHRVHRDKATEIAAVIQKTLRV